MCLVPFAKAHDNSLKRLMYSSLPFLQFVSESQKSQLGVWHDTNTILFHPSFSYTVF